MTEKRREEAIERILNQLEDGYIDLGLHDDDELDVVKEAMRMLQVVDKFCDIPTVNPFSAEECRKALER